MFNPQKIVLFGSQARGTANEHSDADLLVIARFTGRRRDILVEMDRSLRDAGFALDLVLLTPEEYDRDREIPGTVARPASQEGKVLYERSA
ncbi:MAG: nucleotidyltransferase domain-containing protein [Candidatus Latescibacterota bacterium]